jgi:hypothetical protein
MRLAISWASCPAPPRRRRRRPAGRWRLRGAQPELPAQRRRAGREGTVTVSRLLLLLLLLLPGWGGSMRHRLLMPAPQPLQRQHLPIDGLSTGEPAPRFPRGDRLPQQPQGCLVVLRRARVHVVWQHLLRPLPLSPLRKHRRAALSCQAPTCLSHAGQLRPGLSQAQIAGGQCGATFAWYARPVGGALSQSSAPPVLRC